MKAGFVKWYNVNKKYGFIHPDIFVGPEALEGMPDRVSPNNPTGWLETGDQVTYEAVMTPNGLKATRVKLL